MTNTQFNRLLLLGPGLLLLAACSREPATNPPVDVRAYAGPHYAQLYWNHQDPAALFEVEVRDASADGAPDEWRPAAAVMDPGQNSALVTVEPGSVNEFRVGVWDGDQIVWTAADQPVEMGDGITLQVGTMNRWDGDPDGGTAFLAYLDLPAGTAGPLQLEFSGPPGWAAGAHPRTVSVDELDSGHVLEYLYALPPLPGRYDVTVSDAAGNEWSHGLEFRDEDFRLPLSADLTVSVAPDAVTAAWLPPVEDGAAEVVLLNSDLTPFTDYVRLSTASHTFQDLDLAAAGPELLLEVTASNVTFGAGRAVMPVPYGVSVASAAFNTGR